MRLIRSVVFVLGVLMFCMCPGCGGNPDTGGKDEPKPEGPVVTTVTNKTYQSFWLRQFDYKTMPVCAFNGAPIKVASYNKSLATDEHYKKMAECGINTCYAIYDRAYYKEEVARTLELAEKYNISYIAADSGYNTVTDEDILRKQIYNPLLKNKPKALGGVIITDEPSYTDFESIARANEIFKKVLGKKYFCHSNLLPVYGSQQQFYSRTEPEPGSGYTYEQYLDDYLRIVKPQILSYDHYPFVRVESISGSYFENMSIIRKKAVGNEIPFWVYIQTCGYNDLSYAPDKPQLQWLVNSSLAYGAKGIQYFTYVQAVDSAYEKFTGALVDRDGNVTDLYYAAQEVNKFISEADEVLMCSLNKGVMISGTSPYPVPEADVIDGYKRLKSVTGESVMAGCFDYKGREAFYVINNNYEKACTAALNFEDNAGGFVHSYTKKEKFSDKKEIQIVLEAGKAALVVLDKQG